MADFFWIDNSGDINDSNHYSSSSGGSAGGDIPGESDTLYFDLNSFSTTGQTVSANVPIAVTGMDWRTVTNAPVLDMIEALSFTNAVSLRLGTNMTIVGTNSFELISGGNIDGKGVLIPSLILNGENSAINLLSSLNTSYFKITNSSKFNSKNYPMTIGEFEIEGTCSVTLGTSNLTCDSLSAVYNDAKGTINFGTSTLNINDSFTMELSNSGTESVFSGIKNIVSGTGNTFTFNGGSISYNYLTLKAGTNTITDSNTITNLSIDAGKEVQFQASSTQTLTDLSGDGISGSLTYLRSNSTGSQFTLSKSSGTLSINYVQIKDSIATGGATFEAGMEGYDLLNNTGWTFIRGDYLSKDLKPQNEIETKKSKNDSVTNLKSIESEVITETPQFNL